MPRRKLHGVNRNWMVAAFRDAHGAEQAISREHVCAGAVDRGAPAGIVRISQHQDAVLPGLGFDHDLVIASFEHFGVSGGRIFTGRQGGRKGAFEQAGFSRVERRVHHLIEHDVQVLGRFRMRYQKSARKRPQVLIDFKPVRFQHQPEAVGVIIRHSGGLFGVVEIETDTADGLHGRGGFGGGKAQAPEELDVPLRIDAVVTPELLDAALRKQSRINPRRDDAHARSGGLPLEEAGSLRLREYPGARRGGMVISSGVNEVPRQYHRQKKYKKSGRQ